MTKVGAVADGTGIPDTTDLILGSMPISTPQTVQKQSHQKKDPLKLA